MGLEELPEWALQTLKNKQKYLKALGINKTIQELFDEEMQSEVD